MQLFFWWEWYNFNDVDEDASKKEDKSNPIYSYAQKPPEDIKDADVPDENDYNYIDGDEDVRNKEEKSDSVYSYTHQLSRDIKDADISNVNDYN